MELLGNILGLIGAIFMVIASSIKSKKMSLLVQTLQMFTLALCNIVLGGISGFIINLISSFRNILGYYNKLNKHMIGIIIIISTILTILFNNLGIWGYIPLVSNTIFILFMNTKDPIKFKILTIVTLLLWGIHDFYIHAYTIFIFNCISIVAAFIAILRLKNSKTIEK